jgi:hypothetical protein
MKTMLGKYNLFSYRIVDPFLTALLSYRRWELYHGHNSEDGQWGSQSRNPRQPKSLPFAAIQSADIDVKSAADLSLLRSRISNYDDSIHREFEKVTATAAASPSDSSIPYSPAATTATATTTSPADTSKTDAPGELQGNHPVDPTRNPEIKDAAIVKRESVVAPEANEPKALPNLDLPQESAEYYCLAAHLLSPSSSGLYDELMALVKMEVLKIHSSGIPIVSRDWFSKVDIVILDDMDRCWGSDADPEGRFSINEEMRDTLEEQWVKSGYGWSTADDPNDLVFDFEVIDEWREAFEGQMEEKANYTEGVGRFGL